MIKRLLIKIIAGFWLSGPRYRWSKIHRFFFERKYKYVAMPQVKNLGDIASVLRQVTWTQDSWNKLFDSVSYPGRVYQTKKDDCDGFAILAIELLKQLQVRGYMYTYVPEKWTKAHTICVFRYNGFVCTFNNFYLVRTDATTFKRFREQYFREPCVVWDLRDEDFRRVKNI